MEAKAQARYVRVTPMKARRVINEIRGMNAAEALDVLEYAPQGVASDIRKIVQSAIANARYESDQAGERFDDSELKIVETYVDEGPTMKRIRPRAKGSASRIRKRTSHITIIVSTREEA